MSLRHTLAAFGFESNDDYDYALRCLFEAGHERVRSLHVDGEAGRRKTAFASALARALEYPHVLYHDFSRAELPVTPSLQSDGSEAGQALEAPLSAFERAMTEGCAYSEAERTILILDQLQAGDFADHIRLYEFVQSRQWSNAAGTVLANPRNLLLVLISEEPLYHSLAKVSFRVWTDAQRAFLDYRPEDFGLGRDARALFDALARMFETLGSAPTPGEYQRMLPDLLQRVRSEEHLRTSLFGWVEGIDRARLYAPELTAYLRNVVDEIARHVGEDHIEM